MNDSEQADLIAAYALGALSEADRARVEALLESSAEARAALRDYEEALAGFAALTPARRPPEGHEARFLARLNSAEGAIAPQAGASPASTARITQESAKVRTGTTRTRTTPRRTLGLAFAAVAVLAIGVLAIWLWLNDPARLMDRIVNDPAAVRVALAPIAGAAPGQVEFVAVPGSGQGVLVPTMPPLPADRQYQFWFIRGDQITSGGVFNAEGRVLVTIPEPTGGYTLGVTVEPAGGSPQPTMSPILVGEF